MFLKSVLFNVFTIVIGAGYLWFGHEAYLIGNLAVALLGIVGGAVIVLFSSILIVLKILTA